MPANDIDDIENRLAAYMASIENAWQPFKDIDSEFHALDYLEETVDDSGGYPLSFRTPPEFWQSNKATGEADDGGGRQGIQYQFRRFGIVFVVGLNSNAIRSLTSQTARYIGALQQLYLLDYSMGGLVDNTWLEVGKMGPWSFHEGQHYGFMVPARFRFRSQYRMGR